MILLYLLMEWSQECIYRVARHVREHAYVKSLNVKILGQESRLSVDNGQSYRVVSQHDFELRTNHCWHLPAFSVGGSGSAIPERYLLSDSPVCSGTSRLTQSSSMTKI